MSDPIDPRVLENFERAFSEHTGSCRVQCNCGRTFYNYTDRGCWDVGELEALEKNPEATAVDYTIGHIGFEGRVYADGCTCWHQRAAVIIAFLDYHAASVAEWMKLEKKRKQAIADASPTVD